MRNIYLTIKPSQSHDLERGDIIWISSNPTKGHEQDGFRPHVVISKRPYQNTGMAILLPMTTRQNVMFGVPVSGLQKPTQVICDQPRTLDINARAYKYDGIKLTKEELEEVLGRLKAIIF